jgi:hypothetical protein
MSTLRFAPLCFSSVLVLVACGDTSVPGGIDPPGKRPNAGKVDAGMEDAANASGTAIPTSPSATPDAAPRAEPPACTLDTRTVYLQDGKKIESITARGSYWVRTLAEDGTATEADGFPRLLTDEPKMVDGPCANKSPCVLDARTVYFDGAAKVESIFAHGQYWVWGFDANGAVVPNQAFPQPLEATQALALGPCAGQPAGACVIDTRSLYFEGGAKIETMTAQGRFWVNQIAPDGTRSPTGPNGRPIEEAPRMAQGPCKYGPAGACKLDTRAVYIDTDGTKTEEVTAYGRYWVFRLAADGSLIETPITGPRLTSIPRFVGPCK